MSTLRGRKGGRYKEGSRSGFVTDTPRYDARYDLKYPSLRHFGAQRSHLRKVVTRSLRSYWGRHDPRVCLLSINQQAFLRCGRIGRGPRRVKTCVGRSSSRKSSTSSRHSFGECRYQGCWVEWHGCMRAVVPLPVRGRRKRMRRQSRSVGLITSFRMHGYLRGLQNGWRFAGSSMANRPSTQRC